MADDPVKKTVTLTHRQAAGASASLAVIVASVMAALQPTLNSFQTKELADIKKQVIEEKMNTQQEQIRQLTYSVQRVDDNVTSSKTELVTMLRRLADVQREAMNKTEERQRVTDERQDRGIELLMQSKNSSRQPRGGG